MSTSTSSVITPAKLRQADDEFVVAVLDAMKIPYKTWGTGKSTKTLKNFLGNWHLGKITWDPESSSDTIEIDIAVVTVVWEINNFKRELREKYRQLKNGRVPKHHELPGSLAETLRHSDTSLIAALRGLGEKLGQVKPGFMDPARFQLTPLVPTALEPVPSVDYPGFNVKFTYWPLLCQVNEHLYEEEYVFEEPDKTTYWHWVNITPEVAPKKP